jgi:uncharacterized protein (DUF1499 family)
MYDEPRASGVSRLAAWLGAVSLIALVASGPLHRIGIFGLTGLFNLLKWAVYGALAGMVLAIIGFIVDVRRGARTSAALMAMLMCFVATGSVAAVAWKASRLPPIHDVTTDTMQPPPFLAVLALRDGALNPVEYGGPDVAAQQKKAFPDIEPLTLKLPPARAFDRALATARSMGWDLVASDPAGGRIEATATTFWFGFKDDVVIRVTPDPEGSRIDVRSLSRVGGGDIGTNAERVRKYLAALKAS